MSDEDSRELIQETFLSVHKHLRELRDESQFAPWLLKIALNFLLTIIERGRAQKRNALLVPWENRQDEDDSKCGLSPADTVPSKEHNPMEIALEKEKLEKLYEVMRQLPERMRRCIILRVMYDLSYQEIASLMDISIGAVKAHMHEAKKSLREKLGDYFSELDI